MADPHAEQAARQALEIFEELGDDWQATRTQLALARLRLSAGDPAQAEALLAEAARSIRPDEERWTWLGVSASIIEMMTYLESGRLQQAYATGRRALARYPERGGPFGTAIRGTLGWVAELLGDYEEANQLQQATYHDALELGLLYVAAEALIHLGVLATITSDMQRAEVWFDQAAALVRRTGSSETTALLALARAGAARRRGDLEAARALYGQALASYRQLGAHAWIAQALTGLGTVQELTGDLDQAQATLEQGLDAARAAHDPRLLAAALEALACVAVARSDGEGAARLLGSATALREQAQLPLPAAERIDVDRADAAARALLRPAAFQAAFQQGTADRPRMTSAP